jgi:hypothetical protein
MHTHGCGSDLNDPATCSGYHLDGMLCRCTCHSAERENLAVVEAERAYEAERWAYIRAGAAVSS